MNLSGEAVQAVQHYYKLAASAIMVVHDDVDVTFGAIRTKFGGGDAGHNGLKSIIQYSGNDFYRIRIGIANEKMSNIPLENFVLMAFSGEEQDKMPLIFKQANSILKQFIENGSIEPSTIQVQ